MQVASTDLRSLAVFRAVVEHRGFLGAQVALGLSQSAVSFHIKALEERLGLALCRRGRGGFELTDRGAIVYEQSNLLFLALDTFESRVGGLKRRITGTLRLGLVDNTITDPDLPIHRLIAVFGRKAPDAVLTLAIDAPEALLAALGNGGIDIAILPETQNYRGLKFSPLRDERHSLYCAASHPLYHRPEATTEDIEKHAFVVRPYANSRELHHFPNAVAGIKVSNMEAQALFIMSGRYIGYLPDHYAKLWVGRGEMRPIMADTASIASPFFIAARAADRPTALRDLFMTELIGLASERAHLRSLADEAAHADPDREGRVSAGPARR